MEKKNGKDKLDKTFKYYLELFKGDKELGQVMQKMSFQDLFNAEFLTKNTKFTSMDDMIWRSGFGIMNLLEVENVNREKWDAYIAENTPCATWHEFGKMAMIDWMKKTVEGRKKK